MEIANFKVEPWTLVSVKHEEPTYSIRVSPSLSIAQIGTPPSMFHRFMMRLFFGWRFDIYDDH